MKIIICAALFLVQAIASSALAQVLESSQKTCADLKGGVDNINEIYYINGINNTASEALASKEQLCGTLYRYGLRNQNVELLYNPKGSIDLAPFSLTDANELIVQAQISSDARQEVEQLGLPKEPWASGLSPQEKYLYNLGVKYMRGQDNSLSPMAIYGVVRDVVQYVMQQTITNKKTAVIVAHSQGNFAAEAAYSVIFSYSKGQVCCTNFTPAQYKLALERLRIVAIAPTSSTSPGNKYILASQDRGVNAFMLARLPSTAKYFQVQDSNITFCRYIEAICSVFDPFPDGYSTYSDLLISIQTERQAHGIDVFYNSEGIGVLGEGRSSPRKIYDLVAAAIAEFKIRDGHRYELITCGTWSQCRDAAIAKGGSLVTIRNQAENDWLTTNLLQQAKPDFAVWIGFTDAGHEGNWTWASGEVKPYSNWYPGEPNNSGNVENYAIIYNSGAYKDKWNDVQNDYPYVTKAVVEYSSP